MEVIDQSMEFHKDECFANCKQKARLHVVEYECKNDMSVFDTIGKTCAWYNENPQFCGFYDSKGK